MSTHYETLGLTPAATHRDIKRAWREAARQHHPDAGGEASTFLRFKEAFDVLSDPIRRLDYDRNLEYARQVEVGETPAATPPPATTTHQAQPLRAAPSWQLLLAGLTHLAGTVGASWFAWELAGRVGILIAGVWVAANAAALVLHWRGDDRLEDVFTKLVGGEFLVAGGLTALAALGWALGNQPWPLLAWAAIFGAYGLGGGLLWRWTGPGRR